MQQQRPTRREFLAAGAGLGAWGLLSGCNPLYEVVARQLDADAGAAGAGAAGNDDGAALPHGAAIDADFHFLQRASFGPRPGDRERVRQIGQPAWLEEQLAPERIDDGAATLLSRRFESLHLQVGDLFEFKRNVIISELHRATLIRAISSRRQLFEVMVEFWSDHLSIDQGKGECAHLKTADDRDVIRKHALGRVRDLIRASATSPAMLVYLDGVANQKRNSMDVPNENYARELLELHTLGVHGGYTQEDVMETARALTGWRIKKDGFGRGRVAMHADRHDDAAKRILGVAIPAGLGADDVERVVDIVTSHPSTHSYIAAKLCRRFVSDDPPAALVERVATTLAASDGEIKPALRAIFESSEFQAARGAKLKRPFRFVVSAMRALDITTADGKPEIETLRRLGHLPFAHPTPDGYPDTAPPWMGSFFWRWHFALGLARGARHEVRIAPVADPLALVPQIFGRAPSAAENAAFCAYLAAAGDHPDAQREVLALALASPAFQVH